MLRGCLYQALPSNFFVLRGERAPFLRLYLHLRELGGKRFPGRGWYLILASTKDIVWVPDPHPLAALANCVYFSEQPTSVDVHYGEFSFPLETPGLDLILECPYTSQRPVYPLALSVMGSTRLRGSETSLCTEDETVAFTTCCLLSPISSFLN